MKLKNIKFKPKIFWIGPLIPSYCFKDWPAASPAAMKWQKHLLQALVDKGIDTEWLYYRPDPYWPRGRLLPSIVKIKSKIIFEKEQINYVNILGLKNFTLKKSLEKILKMRSKSNEFQPLIIISYNSTNWINKIFLDQNIKKKFICIYIIADYEVLKGAKGYVFLSYYSFKKHNNDHNKLHLDGAVYPPDQIQSFQQLNKKKNKIIFFYSGSFYKWGGVKILLDAMNHIKKDNLELWISGQGNEKLIKLHAKKDKRIKYFGLLNNNRLQNTYNKVDVFLNPRPVNMQGNEINFPSKLFDYLAWNKPIISTWTKSLSPVYKKVLHVVDDDPVAIAFAMSSYLKVKKFYKIKNENWIYKKNWPKQASKLINFIKKIYNKI